MKQSLTNIIPNTMTNGPIDEATRQLLKYHYHRLSICNEDSYLLLSLHQILDIQASSSYSIIHLANGKQLLTCKTLKTWEDEINHPYFYRCHRSYIVNTKHIHRIHLKTNMLEVEGVKIPIARLRKGSDTLRI